MAYGIIIPTYMGWTDEHLLVHVYGMNSWTHTCTCTVIDTLEYV